MGMSVERQGEIAFLAVKAKFVQDGIPGDWHRNVGNEAKKLGISKRETLEFYKAVISGAIDDISNSKE